MNEQIVPARNTELRNRRLQVAGYLAIVIAFAVVIFLIRSIIFPVLFALFLAYTLHHLVDKLTKLHFNRTLGSLVVVCFSGLMGAAVLLILIPSIVQQVQLIGTQIPDYIEDLSIFYLDHVSPWFEKNFDIVLPRYVEDIKKLAFSKIQEGLPLIIRTVKTGVSGAFSGTVGAAGFIFNLITIPFFTFFFLRDYPRFVSLIKQLIPLRYHSAVFPLLVEIDHNLFQYFRGQFIVMIILSFIYSAGLSIIGLDSAIALGILSGVLFWLPFIGHAIAYILAMLLALLTFDSWTTFLWISILYLFATQLESFVLTPKITGDHVGLVPWQVVLLIMIFASLFGVIGFIIAIPLGAVIRIIVKRLWRRYLQSQFYTAPLELKVK